MRFVHLKIKSKDQRLRGFDHNAIFYVMETCSSTAYTTVVSHSMWGKRLFQINCIFFCLQQKICALAINIKKPKYYLFTQVYSLYDLIGELLPSDGKQVKRCYLANVNTKLF